MYVLDTLKYDAVGYQRVNSILVSNVPVVISKCLGGMIFGDIMKAHVRVC